MTKPDWQLQHAAPMANTDIAVNYAWDRDGRMTQLSSNLDSSGLPGKDVRFVYEYQGGGALPGTDSVFNAARVNGAYWLYYYNARNERLRKESPEGTSDEYFWGPGHELLEDRGVHSSATPLPALTEYVWLGGRPVIMWRNLFSAQWERTEDLTKSACVRDGEAADCAPYAVLTDHIGKPVAVLDMDGRVAGVGEYESFGHVNRMASWAEMAHPYTAAQGMSVLSWGFGQVPVGMTFQLRAKLLLDTEPYQDYAVVTDGAGTPLSSWVGGYHFGEWWTEWVTPRAQDGYQAQLRFWQANNVNCVPYQTCQESNWDYRGVAMSNYQYRRYQAPALPVFTPLRFPGHYYDVETDLHQNWNRFMGPEEGRYLAIEPALSQPKHAANAATGGMSMVPYAYAANSPSTHTDATGEMLDCTSSGDLVQLARRMFEQLKQVLKLPPESGDVCKVPDLSVVTIEVCKHCFGRTANTDGKKVQLCQSEMDKLNWSEMICVMRHEACHLASPPGENKDMQECRAYREQKKCMAALGLPMPTPAEKKCINTTASERRPEERGAAGCESAVWIGGSKGIEGASARQRRERRRACRR